MDFYKYVSEKMPAFESVFSTKEVEELKKLFDTYMLWSKVKNTRLQILEQSDLGVNLEEREQIIQTEANMKQMLDERIDSIIAEHLQQFSNRFVNK